MLKKKLLKPESSQQSRKHQMPNSGVINSLNNWNKNACQ